MKKITLGVLALSCISSFASGYVKTNSEARVYNTSLEKGGIEKPGYEIKPNLALGLLLGEQKEAYVFLGGNLKFETKLENGNQKPSPMGSEFYLGTRIDTNVAKNVNLKLTFLYDKTSGNKEDAFVNRLKEQEKWNSKLTDKEKDEYKEALYLSGYKLFDKDNTLLISSVFNEKYNELDYTLGFIYGSKDFENNTFESFAKAKLEYDKFELEGSATSTLGRYIRLKRREIFFEGLLEDAEEKTNNLKNGGKLDLEAKISSNKLVDNLSLSAKGFTNFDTVLPKEKTYQDRVEITKTNAHLFKTGLEIEAKYTLNKNELKLGLNYRNEVINEPEKEKTIDKITYTGNVGDILHKPELVLGLKHKADKLNFETELIDEVNIRNTLATTKLKEKKGGKTEVKKIDLLANKVLFKNKLDYKLNEFIQLGFVANYKFKVLFDKFISARENKYSHRFVVVPNLIVDIKKDNYELKSDNRVRYFFDLDKAVDYRKHGTLVYSDTNAKINLNKLTLEPKLLLVNLNRVDLQFHKGDAIAEKIYSKHNGRFNNKDFSFIGYALARPSLKLKYSLDRFELSTELEDHFAIFYAKGNDNKNTKLTFNEIVNTAKLNTEAGYKVTDEVKPSLGLGLSHSFTNSETQRKYTSEDFAKAIVKTAKEYDGTKDENLTDSLVNAYKDIKDEKGFNEKHLVTINPFVKVESKLLNDKLIIEPKVEAIVKFGSDLKKDDIKFRHIEGKGTLKIEYMW